MPSSPVRGGAQDEDDRPPLPGAYSDWPALARRLWAAIITTPLYGMRALYTVTCMTLSRRTPEALAGSALGTGRSLLRAVSVAGSANRLPEGDGRVRAGSFMGLRTPSMGLRAEQTRATRL